MCANQDEKAISKDTYVSSWHELSLLLFQTTEQTDT